MPSAGAYGSTSGTSEGPGTMSQTTNVTKIIGYGDGSYIFGIKLFWGTPSLMYGQTGGASGITLSGLTDDPVCEVKYLVTSGILRGVKFTTVDSRILEVGLTTATSTAFSGSTDEFTDMVTYKGTVNNVEVIWGATFYYKVVPIPKPFSGAIWPQEMAWPSLAIMAHTFVVSKSFMKVGKLRGTLGINAPSCDPSPTTSPSDAQLWYRTFRAQENCKEMFLVYLPSILIASSMGYRAFGKWAPRAVGALGLIGAFFRLKYLNAYIEDADKRGKPFGYAMKSMQPIFYLAILSSGYLVGKELYRCIQGCCSEKSEEHEEKEQ